MDFKKVEVIVNMLIPTICHEIQVFNYGLCLTQIQHYLPGNRFVFFIDYMALVYLINKPEFFGKIIGYCYFWSMTSNFFISLVDPI
jgi:hypothetical protein